MTSRPSSSDPASARRAGPIARHPPSAGAGTAEGGLRVTWYADGTAHERAGSAALAALPELLRAPDHPVWVDLASPPPELIDRISTLLGLHPLIVEDVLEGNQRPKLEQTDGLIHVVLFSLDYRDGIESVEIDLVLGLGFLLTVHDRSWDPRASHHMRGGTASILAHGVDHLLWALCDEIIDGYFPFADRLGDALDASQDEVVRGGGRDVLERVFVLKRELHEVRRLVSPVREVFNELTNRDSPLIDAAEVLYFRDIYDHVIRLTDELDNYRELAGATLEVYLTQVNNNLSVIMKRLTGVTVILAGIGAVAGIFGMSEAGTALAGGEAGGFWLVAAVTVLGAGVAAAFLRWIDWI
ncbi:MAG TPA: magnesium transporter CorA family protein [Clostridia bacterium]|nr:magnesium transporter CorA family protein [Clostridia bacterium]